MTHHPPVDPTVQEGLFDVEEVKLPETKEQIASRQARAIFGPWYQKWYKGRYTQSEGHIIKVLKNVLLKTEVTPYHLEWAMNILGEQAQVITEPSLQFAMSKVTKYLESKGMTLTTTTQKREYVEYI